jgi:threonine dehydrogenase-like Zn-dependent dehydrogenase
MQAVLWDGSAVSVAERPDPAAGAGMATVAVTLAGVCDTDLEIVRGYMGFRGILGHELVGVVEDGPSRWAGKRVVSEINFACGRCAACRVAVPIANLHEVPAGVRNEDAVFAEPLAAAFEILEQRPVEPGERAVVLGDGKLGLLVAQVLARAGARVHAVGRHPEKLRVLAALGIETSLAADYQPRKQADLAVEATGSVAGLEVAVAATRPRGTIVLKSTVAGRHELDLAPLVVDEIQVLGSRCGPFEPALSALAAGEVAVAPLVTDRLPLARGDDALRRAAEPGVLKVLIDCAT